MLHPSLFSSSRASCLSGHLRVESTGSEKGVVRKCHNSPSCSNHAYRGWASSWKPLKEFLSLGRFPWSFSYVRFVLLLMPNYHAIAVPVGRRLTTPYVAIQEKCLFSWFTEKIVLPGFVGRMIENLYGISWWSVWCSQVLKISRFVDAVK